MFETIQNWYIDEVLCFHKEKRGGYILDNEDLRENYDGS